MNSESRSTVGPSKSELCMTVRVFWLWESLQRFVLWNQGPAVSIFVFTAVQNCNNSYYSTSCTLSSRRLIILVLPFLTIEQIGTSYQKQSCSS